jgi:hypothetical protein
MLESKADAVVEASEATTAIALRKQLPSMGNIVAVEALTATVRFRYRGRVFDAPPIPTMPGLKLQAMELELERMGDEPPTPSEDDGMEKMMSLKNMLLEMFDIMWKHVEPVGIFDRLFWEWRENPFADASRKEVAELLAFFSQCRKISSVQLLAVRLPESNHHRSMR